MPAKSTDAVIDVNQLHKSFHEKMAVQNVSLQVHRGNIFGFLGPNGAGKTTTIRMLCGLLTPDGGTGKCLGFDIVTESMQIKKRVGYMTQHFGLYADLTVEENLDFMARLYGVKNRQAKINDILHAFELQPRRAQLTETLSGGWKQRLSLSAALLHDPELLLLDEPTAGVDPKARRDFWDYIYALSQRGVTTLVSTHYMDEAARCTHLVYISQGCLLTQGTPQEIVAQSALFTWEVDSADFHLSEKLKELPGADSVVFFGEKLHVSGYDGELLQKSIQQFTPTLNWKKISPELEDVFIVLAGKTDRSE